MNTSDVETAPSKISKIDLLYPFAIALLMLSVFSFTGMIFSFLLFILRINGYTYTEDTATLLNLAINLIAEIGLILIFAFLLWREKLEPDEKVVPSTKPVIFTYLVYAFECFFLFGILPMITLFLQNFEEVSSPYETFSPTVTLLSQPLYYILFFGVLSFGAATSEELAFRRALIPMLERRGLGTFWVLIISGLTFSLMHTPADLINGTWTYAIIHLFSTFIGGAALGFVYIRTRNIFYPILLHGFSNGISGVLQIAYAQFELGNTTLISLGLLWIFVMIFLGATIVGYVIYQLYQYRGYPHPPVWIQLLVDRKVIKTNLKVISFFALVFVLVRGGIDIMLDLLFSVFAPSIEGVIIQFVVETTILLLLILITGFFIWRIANPLLNPIFVSELQPFTKKTRYRHPGVTWGNITCYSCGEEVPRGNRFCIYCGQNLERELSEI